MAIERFGGTPDDPNRQPDPDSSAKTPDPAINPATGRPWGSGGRTLPTRGDSQETTPEPAAAPEPDGSTAPTVSSEPAGSSEPAASPEPAVSPERAAPFDAPTAPTAPVTQPTGFAPPPTFELPVPPVYPPSPPQPAPQPRRGSVNRQEAGVTAPRPPTVAEARAREKARKRAEEAEQAATEAAETKRKKKKKVLIGGAAVVGVAALVGGGYLAYDALTTPEVTAYCTVVAKKGQVVAVGNGQTVTATSDNQEIVIPDNYCDDAKRTGSTGLGGIFILNGSQYRYYYGGSGNTIGHAPTGGSTVLPKGADVKTKSGSTIQRGGLGSKISGGGS
ncbi:hypothetical protein ACFVUS_13020 [Nocardia sp. NPDC058058]|uniref:hypothetical protein n=1 Tax=Nocardia sp. NPDC058058 TaxID=3346317 RepID=UPI0036D8F135